MYEALPHLFAIDYVIKYQPNIDPNSAINQLLSGVDIILVDPQLYPQLISPLYVFRDIYKQGKQFDLVKKCDFFIDYINEYPKKQQISRMLMNRPPSPPPKPPVLDPQEVNQIVDNLLQTNEIKFYPRDELELILAELRKRRAMYQKTGDYLNAQKADHYTKAILNYGQLGAVEILQNSKVDEIRAKMCEAENKLEVDKKKWESLHNSLRSQAKNDLISIDSQYESKIREIEELSREEPPPSLRNPSALLLQLRARQKAMVESKHYSEAADVKEKADALELDEKAQHRNMWAASINSKLDAKRKEKAKQIEGRMNYWKQEEEALIKQANNEIGKAEMAIEHIKSNLKEAESAQNTAAVLKETTKVLSKGLPSLTNAQTTDRAAEYRQRAILNSKIYTKKPEGKVSNLSLTKRKKEVKQ